MSTSLIAGPSGDRLPDVRDDVLGFLERCARDHGALVSFELTGRPWVLVNDPELIHQVLTAPFAEIDVGPSALPGVTTMGHSIMLNFDSSWRSRRALVQRPLAHRHVYQQFEELMTRHARELADSWQAKPEVELHAEMEDVTRAIIAEALYSGDIDEAVPKIQLLAKAFHVDFVDLWLGPPRTPDATLLRAVADLDATIHAIIARRRAGADPGDDLLGTLLGGVDEDGRPLDDDAIRDEANTLLFAGHQTSALTLTWALALLAQHPDVQRELAEAIDAHVGCRPLAVADLEGIPLIRAVVDETLRLYPVAYFQDRTAAVSLELADATIDPGTRILISAWVVHRDERHFPEPNRFRPERFLPEQRKSVPKRAYLPFGGGPKICAGNHFALLEAAVVLGTIVQRFDFELVAAGEPRIAPTSLLDPADDMLARVRPRSAAPSSTRAAGS